MEENRVWLVAYLIRDFIGTVERDLNKHGFNKVGVYIPTVKIIKKQNKGKNIYEEVPLLFNYGFFSMPYKDACTVEVLTNLRKKVPCIYSWVKDPLSKVPISLRGDNKDRQKPEAAIVSEQDIVNLVKASEKFSVFADDIVDKLSKGDYITLKGYPYEGIPAEITKVNKKINKVTVKLLLENLLHEVDVPFENVYYTVYTDFDAESPLGSRDISIDEWASTPFRNVDKLFASMHYGEE